MRRCIFFQLRNEEAGNKRSSHHIQLDLFPEKYRWSFAKKFRVANSCIVDQNIHFDFLLTDLVQQIITTGFLSKIFFENNYIDKKITTDETGEIRKFRTRKCN